MSPNGRFIGLSLLVSTFPLSTMGLILVPKMLAVRKEKVDDKPKRGSKAGTRVSGLDENRAHPIDATETRQPSETRGSLASQTGLPSPRIQVVTIE